MDHIEIAKLLERNGSVFEKLLSGLDQEIYSWREQENKWSLLEVVCHLYDEELEDFRTRVSMVLNDPNEKLPTFDPEAWVKDRDYASQDYETKLASFLEERVNSVNWLRSLEHPLWGNTYQHPSLGPLSAGFFLKNWLAHDYLHLRQINRMLFRYLEVHGGEKLHYAGDW